MAIIVRDSKTGEIINTSRDITAKDIESSDKKRKASGRATPDSSSFSTSVKTDTGGTLTTDRTGKVTIRDAEGNITSQYQADRGAVNEFINQSSAPVPDRSTRTISGREGLYAEIGADGSINKTIYTRDSSGGFTATGSELTPEGRNVIERQADTNKPKIVTQDDLRAQQEAYYSRQAIQRNIEQDSREDKLSVLLFGKDIGSKRTGDYLRELRDSRELDRQARTLSPSALANRILGINYDNPFKPETTISDFGRYGSLSYMARFADKPLTTSVETGLVFVAPAVTRAEYAFLKALPRGTRFLSGVGLTTAQSQAISSVVKGVNQATAPERLKPYLAFDDVYRESLAFEQGKMNVGGRIISGLNTGLNTNQLRYFEAEATRQLQAKGLTGEALTNALEAQLYRRTRTEPYRELLVTLNAGRFAEGFGRMSVSNLPASSLQKGFGGRYFDFAKAIAPAGFIEARGEVAGQRASVGSSLPLFSDKLSENILPSFNVAEGLTFKSRLAEDIGIGAFGATTAGLIGGAVGAGYTASAGKAGGFSRKVGAGANFLGNVLDVSEPVTDLLAGSPKAFMRAPVVSITPSITPSSKGRVGSISNAFTQAFSFTPSVAPVSVPSLTPVDIFVPTTTKVPSNVPSVIPSIVPSNTNINSEVPSLVPSIVPSSVPASVPVLSSVWRLPPPVPLSLPASSGGGNLGGKAMKKYVNELQQGSVLLGGLLGTSKGVKPKIKAKKKTKGGRQNILPFKIL